MVVHIQPQFLGHVVPVFTVGQDRNRQAKIFRLPVVSLSYAAISRKISNETP
jgi:hypothetical protein